MKFLCVPCDSPMKLQSVGPADRGSLSIVYACPECGYEMAMLTNAYETQAVQSLGVRIGPESDAQAPGPVRAESDVSGSKCPFAAMIPGTEDVQPLEAQGKPSDGAQGKPGKVAESAQVRWTAGAEARLANVPAFVRPMARAGIERFAREKGCLEVDEKILEAAREFFGM